ncbi:MAG: CBS domain-containing protein [Patescibacteria group bacterium]
MFFFSTIFGLQIKDIENKTCGKVGDVFITINSDEEMPTITGIVCKKNLKKIGFISIDDITELGPKKIRLNKKFNEALKEITKTDNVISLYNSILDRQIIDLMGLKIVRVNDLQFGQFKQKLCLIAIDISNRGLLRRLGIKGQIIDNFFKPHFVEWKSVHTMADKLQLSTGAKEIVKLHPADLANIMEKMSINQATAWLQSLDQSTAARVLEEIQPDIKKILVKSLGPERAAAMIAKMSVDELVDIIQLLPGNDSKEIINKLPQDSTTQAVKKILQYDEDTAGGLMTTEFISAGPNSTVQEVIDKIKKVSPKYHSIHYIYITNEDTKFLGVVSLRTLIISDHNKKMQQLVRKLGVPTALADQGLKSLANLMTKYNLWSVAVLDKDQKLIGVITVDDVMRRLVPDA